VGGGLPVRRHHRRAADQDRLDRRRTHPQCLTAREFNSAFEWAAHEREANHVGVPQEVTQSIKFREPSSGIEAPFGTVVELIREAFTAGSVSAATYEAAVSLLGVPLLIDLMSLAGMYASTAALLSVFDMQLDAGETHLLPLLD
jgi:4-carboxymuconolactone decarboxylase